MGATWRVSVLVVASQLALGAILSGVRAHSLDILTDQARQPACSNGLPRSIYSAEPKDFIVASSAALNSRG